MVSLVSVGLDPLARCDVNWDGDRPPFYDRSPPCQSIFMKRDSIHLVPL